MLDRENNDSENREKQSLLSREDLAIERENAALDEELRAAKIAAAETIEWQKKQAKQIQSAVGNYGLFYRTWSLASSVVQLAGKAIGSVTTYLPFMNAIFNGLYYVIDMVEAIFISQETRNRRFVKAANSTISTGLSIASLVVSLNPATAPLGLVFSATAIGISTAKEGFFFYKASRDLRRAKEKLTAAKQTIRDEISAFVGSNHTKDIDQVREINHKINNILEHEVRILPTVQMELSALRQQRQAIIVKINHSVHNQENILSKRTQINVLKENVNQCRIDRNERKKGFFSSLVSFVGVGLLAVAAVTVAAALISNPFGLMVAGVAILGVATVVSIRNKFFPHKPKVEAVMPVVAPANEQLVGDNALHFDHSHSYDVGLRQKYIGDTEKIVRKLVGDSHRREREIWEGQQVAESPKLTGEQAILTLDVPIPHLENQPEPEAPIPIVNSDTAKKNL